MNLILYRNWLPPRLVFERGSLFPLSLFCRSCSCAPYLALRTRTVYPRLSVEPARTRLSVHHITPARTDSDFLPIGIKSRRIGRGFVPPCAKASGTERAIRSLPLPVTYEACRFFCGGSAPSGFRLNDMRFTQETTLLPLPSHPRPLVVKICAFPNCKRYSDCSCFTSYSHNLGPSLFPTLFSTHCGLKMLRFVSGSCNALIIANIETHPRGFIQVRSPLPLPIFCPSLLLPPPISRPSERCHIFHSGPNCGYLSHYPLSLTVGGRRAFPFNLI